MEHRFSGNGISFRYPSGWQIEEQPGRTESSVTVSPEGDSTAFWTVILLSRRPEVEETLETVLSSFEEEYEELDQYPVEEEIAHHPSLGRDLEFVCLELTNSAAVRVFRTGMFTAVILYQATDQEFETFSDEFTAITGSLRCDFDQGTLFE